MLTYLGYGKQVVEFFFIILTKVERNGCPGKNTNEHCKQPS